jgi:thiol-disulfide isomerase/thioredoxin
MSDNTGRRWSVIAIALVSVVGTALAAERTWTDPSGKFNVIAELVAVEGDKVVLRRKDGKQIKVPLEKLSDKDRKFIEASQTEDPVIDVASAAKDITKAARIFYGDLRGSERVVARGLLTEKAIPLMEGEKSPLTHLPKPELGAGSIRTGKVKFNRAMAEIPVRIRAGGKLHQTKLHFRLDADQWRIFAISAMYPDGEKSIDFEAEGVTPKDGEGGNPLQAMIGKPLELAGYHIDGTPLDMADYKGKVVLVDFWATWCGPCRAEMPNILENWKKYHNDGFEVIAISVDQDMKALQAFVSQEKPPWTVVADNHPGNEKKMASQYGIRGIPALVLLGKDGKVVAINCRGQQLGHELSRLIGGRG